MITLIIIFFVYILIGILQAVLNYRSSKLRFEYRFKSLDWKIDGNGTESILLGFVPMFGIVPFLVNFPGTLEDGTTGKTYTSLFLEIFKIDYKSTYTNWYERNNIEKWDKTKIIHHCYKLDKKISKLKMLLEIKKL